MNSAGSSLGDEGWKQLTTHLNFDIFNMINIISLVVFAFFYRKANILCRGSSNILQDLKGTKACVTAADLTDSDGNRWQYALLYAAFEQSQYKNISCASMQDFPAYSVNKYPAVQSSG